MDLSADFRLRDVNTYAEWYGGEHKAPELQKEAVYGLTELHRSEVAGARLVANPGCYPTSVQLPLVPLIRAGLISSQDIIIDAKSGVSGAGRAAKQGTLFCEVCSPPRAPPRPQRPSSSTRGHALDCRERGSYSSSAILPAPEQFATWACRPAAKATILAPRCTRHGELRF